MEFYNFCLVGEATTGNLPATTGPIQEVPARFTFTVSGNNTSQITTSSVSSLVASTLNISPGQISVSVETRQNGQVCNMFYFVQNGLNTNAGCN